MTALTCENNGATSWHLLDGVSVDERRALLRSARRRRFGRNDSIFFEGDPGDTVHLISKGHVAVQITTALGDVATLAVLGPGEVFGELAVVSGSNRRSATVSCLDPTETLVIHSEQFHDLRRRNSSVGEALLQLVTARIPRTSSQLLEALYTRADKRVLRRVVDLSDLYGVVIPLTQDDVAELAGATRPTVNRVLKDAESARAVRLSRCRIEVVDRGLLCRLAG